MKTIYNAETLVAVKVRDKKKCNRLEWQKASNNWFSKSPEGWYGTFLGLYTKEDLEDGKLEGINFIIEGKDLYYKPYVTLFFLSDKSRSIEFHTYEEALAYGTRIANENIQSQLIF